MCPRRIDVGHWQDGCPGLNRICAGQLPRRHLMTPLRMCVLAGSAVSDRVRSNAPAYLKVDTWRHTDQRPLHVQQHSFRVCRPSTPDACEACVKVRRLHARMALPVHWAAGSGDLLLVMHYVENDPAVVHAVDECGWTPLMYASSTGKVRVMEYLLDRGADVNTRSARGQTALYRASCSSHIDTVVFLLSRGADATIGDHTGSTALRAAAGQGRGDIVDVLLRHGGSDVDACAGSRATALWWAASDGHQGIVGRLLHAGADPMIVDVMEGGLTPLDVSVRDGRVGCTRLLQEWQRAYSLTRARRLRDACVHICKSAADARLMTAPSYLRTRVSRTRVVGAFVQRVACPVSAVSGAVEGREGISDAVESVRQRLNEDGQDINADCTRESDVCTVLPRVEIKPQTETGADAKKHWDVRSRATIARMGVVGMVVTGYAMTRLNTELFKEMVDYVGVTDGRWEEEK